MIDILGAFHDTHTLRWPSSLASNRADHGGLRVDFRVDHLRYSTWFHIDGGLGHWGPPSVARCHDRTWYDPNTSIRWSLQEDDGDGNDIA
jgi:hypothetical protein